IENDTTSFHVPTLEKKFNIQTNLLLDTLTILNFNASYLVYYNQQYDIKAVASLTYWNILGLSMLDSGTSGFKASTYGFVPIVMACKSLTDEIALYGGLKYSYSKLSIELDEPIVSEDDEISSLGFDLTQITAIKDVISETAIFWGVVTKLKKNRTFNISVGYQLGTQRIFTNVQYSTKFFNYGLGMYPDSLIFFHPQVNFQYNF
ncbi:hypothetical protein KAU33_06580, partial [Candidatus Dependentiae bacterium]|nr:hypothetical protein [Candidatus Dependentiae bacterium]